MNKIADIHCHSTLFPYARKRGLGFVEEANLWYQIKPKSKHRNKFLPRYTQADFTSLAKGNVRLIFNAFYPIEQGWFDKVKKYRYSVALGRLVTKFSSKRIRQILDKNYNYFSEFLYEYNFLAKQHGSTKELEINGNKTYFKIALPQNKKQLKQFLNEENTLTVIPTIEGITALINGNDRKIKKIKFYDIKENIDKIKNLKYPVFFVTFAHHFYNGFCGHSSSLFYNNKKIQKIILSLIDQNDFIDTDFNSEGIKVLKYLLSIEEYAEAGRRILIDAKHLSIKSRKTFYEIIEKHNKNYPDDIIPIIHSHSAFSGFRTLDSLELAFRFDKELYKHSFVFNPSPINLTSEEVIKIFHSQGLIGISMEEKLITGYQMIEKAKELHKKASTDEIRLFWAKQFLRNILSMVGIIANEDNLKNKEKVWDLFAIGSDFDGFIDPIDGFITAEEYPCFREYLIEALKTETAFEKINFGYSAEDIVNKITFENAKNFLLKNF